MGFKLCTTSQRFQLPRIIGPSHCSRRPSFPATATTKSIPHTSRLTRPSSAIQLRERHCAWSHWVERAARYSKAGCIRGLRQVQEHLAIAFPYLLSGELVLRTVLADTLELDVGLLVGFAVGFLGCCGPHGVEGPDEVAGEQGTFLSVSLETWSQGFSCTVHSHHNTSHREHCPRLHAEAMVCRISAGAPLAQIPRESRYSMCWVAMIRRRLVLDAHCI